MRYILTCAVLSVALLFSSCGAKRQIDRLGYQSLALQVEAIFTLGDERIPITLTLEAPEYDENGRMLARNAQLVLGENSIISGVGFEASGTQMYVCSGVLKIPITDETVVSGISDIISLFCISAEHYHSSERLTIEGIRCERAVYMNGDNRVEVTLDLSCMLPTKINAQIDGRIIAADISYITAK